MEELNEMPILSSSELSSIKCDIKHIPVKRAFDILFSMICLTVGLPIFLFIALLISLTSSGRVIYYHERVGRGGKLFRCYKFRTMYSNADQRLKEILKNDPQKKS